jgi:hypothetical protein
LPFTATAAFDAFATVAARAILAGDVAATSEAVEADAARRLSRRALRADPEDEDVTLSSS